MSSAGQAVGMIAGGVIGSFFGMTALGASIGGMIGSAIDPPKGPDIIGPRLDDLSVQTSTYGAPLARAYGTVAVTGNLFWLEGDKIKESTTTEEQGGKGGPTSETTTYHYSATFAVGLLHVPAGATVSLRRMWIDTDLVFDADSSNLESVIASQTQGGVNFTFYPGADDQTPNPRMQADKGAANVSAYPGMCYIVFEDLSLEKYSNTLMRAQVKAEIVIDSVPTTVVHQAEYLLLVRDYGAGTGRIYPSAVQISASNAKYSVVELDYWNGRPKLAHFCTTSFSDYARVDGEVYIATNNETKRVIFNQCDDLCSGFMEIYYGTTDIKFHLTRGGTDETFASFPATALGDYNPPGNLFVGGWFALLKNNLVYLFNNTYNHKPIYIGIGGFIGEASAAYTIQSAGFSDNYIFAVQQAGSGTTTTVYKFDLSLNLVSTFSQTVTNGVRPAIYVVDDSIFYTATQGFVYKWINGVVVDTFPGAVASDFSTASPSSLGEPPGFFVMVSDSPVYCVSFSFAVSLANQLHFAIAADSVASAAAKLRDIVTDECELAGVASGSLDLAALTNHDVRGYKIAARSSVRAAMEPLQAAFPFDVAASGYKLKFVSRGGASVATIPSEDLGATVGNDLPVLLPIAREMESQLPYRVNVRYADAGREYDVGEQYAERPAESLNERTVELAIVLTADEAAQKADVLLEKEWVERTDLGPFTLPPTWSELEAADVVTIEHRGQQHESRLTRVEYLPDGRLQCQAKLTHAASYVSTSQGSDPLVLGQSLVPLKGSTAGYLLDIPRIRSEQDVPGMSYGMTGLASGWPGGSFLRSDDSMASYQVVASTNVRAKVFTAGVALSAHHGYSIDHGSMLTVTPLYPAHTLSSVTEEQLYSQANLAAYGADGRWEIVAFRTVVDNTGSYTVRDFLRGLYGSEWASGLHETGDLCILLDTSSVGFFGLPTNAIGSQRLYRAVTQGASIDSAIDISDYYEGNNLKPLSPAEIIGHRDAVTGAWKIWPQRRTRCPVELFSGTTVPIGESVEAYEIEIWDSGFTQKIRTIVVSGSNEIEYSSANQIADFGVIQDTLYLRAFQVSSVIGIGYPLQWSKYQILTTDPYFSNVSVLMHMDGVNNGTIFTEVKGNSVTVFGNTCTKTGLKKFGSSSAYFDGGSDYLSIPDGASLDFGSGDFTIEMFVAFTSPTNAAAEVLFCKKSTDAGSSWVQIYKDVSSTRLVATASSDGSTNAFVITTSTGLFSSGVFAHVAITRSGSTFTVWVNGVSVGSTTFSGAIFNPSGVPLRVGANATGSSSVYGYVDDFRITKGTCRYTSTFSVPAEAFPDT